MKSIAIVTDSNCGMSPTQVKDLGIYMLPMPFFIDDKEYLEDIDMNQSEFFQHLEQNPGCRVSTSQPASKKFSGDFPVVRCTHVLSSSMSFPYGKS